MNMQPTKFARPRPRNSCVGLQTESSVRARLNDHGRRGSSRSFNGRPSRLAFSRAGSWNKRMKAFTEAFSVQGKSRVLSGRTNGCAESLHQLIFVLVCQSLGNGDGLQNINQAHDHCQLEFVTEVIHCNRGQNHLDHICDSEEKRICI